jgi:mono/diheme cytochrome c family protein
MKKFLKIIGIIVLIIVALIATGVIYFNSSYPDVPPAKQITVTSSPERIARGAYLAEHVAVCIDCHSQRDFSKFAGPLLPESYGKGGELFDKAGMGLPGNLYAKNITPAVIGNWTDGELLRAFTQGITKDNRALFPFMPYPHYNTMAREDAYSIIAYLRSLKPITNDVPNSELDFPLNMIVKTMPMPTYNPVPVPDKNDPATYGKYLVNMASCNECHTQRDDKGQLLPGMDFAGGMAFNLPSGVDRSANITPDMETGIGRWTKEDFIGRFKIMDGDSARNIPVTPEQFNTPMPWLQYAGMTEEDLGAIYDYLRTLKPVNNLVVKFIPAKKK